MYKFNTENPAMLLAKFVPELAAQECTKIANQELSKDSLPKETVSSLQAVTSHLK